MAIDVLSAIIAHGANVTTLTEITPSVGDVLGPWDVLEVGPGPVSYWFYGGPAGICYPDGTVARMFKDDKQKFKMDKHSLVKVEA